MCQLIASVHKWCNSIRLSLFISREEQLFFVIKENLRKISWKLQKILVVYFSEKTRGFFLEISVLVQVEYMVVGGESRLGCGGCSILGNFAGQFGIWCHTLTWFPCPECTDFSETKERLFSPGGYVVHPRNLACRIECEHKAAWNMPFCVSSL